MGFPLPKIIPSDSIFIDTNIFIYALEDEGRLGDLSRDFFKLVQAKSPRIYTSVITIQETLTGVYKAKQEDRILEYLEFVSGGGSIAVLEITKQIALIAARIRAQFNVSSPDALQIATAQDAKCNLFVTADRRLPPKADSLKIKLIR